MRFVEAPLERPAFCTAIKTRFHILQHRPSLLEPIHAVMHATLTTSRLQAPARIAVVATRPRHATLRAAPRRPLRVQAFVSDVARYLSEAASQIFYPQADNVPWEKSAQAFTGKIVHHEETARLAALKAAVDKAMHDIERSIDEAPATDVLAAGSVTSSGEQGVGGFVTTSIQRVFDHNFTGDATEPQAWVSTGYASSGRHRSQRELRKEYERLQRFQSLVNKVLQEAKASRARLEGNGGDM